MKFPILTLILSALLTTSGACSPVPDPTLRGMPTLLVPAAPPRFPSQLTTPADGDPATAASVNGAFQALIDGEDAARLASVGRRLRSFSVDGTTVTVLPVGGFSTTIAGSWHAGRHNVATAVNAATALGGPLAATTRYHLYAYISGGTVSFVVATDAPDAGLLFRASSTDFLWVATFITDTNGLIVPQTQVDGRVRYLARKAGDGLGLISVTVNAGASSIPPSVAWPSFATVLRVRASGRIDSAGGTIQGAVTLYAGLPAVAAAGYSPIQPEVVSPGWGYLGDATVLLTASSDGAQGDIPLLPGGANPQVSLSAGGTGVITGSATLSCIGFDF